MDRIVRRSSSKLNSDYIALTDESRDGDDYAARFLKIMPVESITIYLFVFQLASKAESPSRLLEWIAFFLILAFTLVYLRRGSSGEKMPWLQVAISIGLYVAWGYSLGGPFRFTPNYDPVWGTIFVAIGTFAMPALYRGSTPTGPEDD